MTDQNIINWLFIVILALLIVWVRILATRLKRLREVVQDVILLHEDTDEVAGELSGTFVIEGEPCPWGDGVHERGVGRDRAECRYCDGTILPKKRVLADECTWSPTGQHEYVYRAKGPVQFTCRHCNTPKPVEEQKL